MGVRVFKLRSGSSQESMAKQPIGTPWALTWVVGISTWPADARPVPPLGNGQVSPVIIGNLHDPNTASGPWYSILLCALSSSVCKTISFS